MPKPCILISSCKRDVLNGMNLAVRDTWGLDSAIPYFFILGDGNQKKWADEVVLNVPDDYFGLTFKTKESIAWAVRTGFTHVFRAFTDTFIDTQRLIRESNYTYHPYIGNHSEPYAGGYTFAHGGPGYWLGPKAIKIILDSAIDKRKFDHHKFEDQWVGQILGDRGITCHDDKRYSMAWSYGKDEQDPLADNEIISAHLSNQPGQYYSDWMHQVYSKRYGLPVSVNVERLKGCNCFHCLRANQSKR